MAIGHHGRKIDRQSAQMTFLAPFWGPNSPCTQKSNKMVGGKKNSGPLTMLRTLVYAFDHARWTKSGPINYCFLTLYAYYAYAWLKNYRSILKAHQPSLLRESMRSCGLHLKPSQAVLKHNAHVLLRHCTRTRPWMASP